MSLNWKYKDSFEARLCSVDIECLLRNNSKIEIKNGIYWENSSKHIFDHLREIMVAKIEQDKLQTDKTNKYNPALRESLKLILNSISGKFLQRIFEKDRKLIQNKKELDSFMNKTSDQTFFVCDNGKVVSEGIKNNLKTTMPSIYGILTYAYSRTYLYEKYIKNCWTRKTTDTDSVVFNKKEYEKIKHQLNVGTEFGAVKEEFLCHMNEGKKGPYGYFVDKKCYCIYKIDKHGKKKEIKLRFKGVSRDDKIIEDPSVLKNASISKLYNIYNSIKETLSIACYDKLINNKPLYVLCSRIRKSALTLSLTQNYCLKIIQPSGEIIETYLD